MLTNKTPQQKLRNSIGMQLMFYTHSGATLEETVERIYQGALDYAKNQNPEPVICTKCSGQLNGGADIKCDKCGSFKKEEL